MGEDKKTDKKRKRVVPKAPVQMIISREYVGTQTVTEAFIPIISEEDVYKRQMVDRLKAALPLLSDSEQALIHAIFFDGLSEREVGARFGITQSVVNKRKARILIKLRKIIES